MKYFLNGILLCAVPPGCWPAAPKNPPATPKATSRANMFMSPRRSAARSPISPWRAAIPSRPGNCCLNWSISPKPQPCWKRKKISLRPRRSLALAKSVFQRRKELRENPAAVVSAEELDQARAQRDSATAEVAAQQAALARAKWPVDQKQQFAPADAAVHDTLYRQGEFVAAGNPVVVLLPPENLKVRFFVPQEKLAQIKIGETVSVKADGAAQRNQRHGELHFHAGRIHAAGDFQPRDARESGVHDRGEIFAGGRGGTAAGPAGGCETPDR